MLRCSHGNPFFFLLPHYEILCLGKKMAEKVVRNPEDGTTENKAVKR